MKRLGLKDTLLLALTLAVVAAGTWWAWSENVVRRVFLVNRLGVPVEVSIDGKPHPLPLAALEPVSLHRGVHQVRVLAGGRVLEEGPVDLPQTSSVLAYNVLGVAPLYREAVYYGSGSANAPESFEFYGGRRVVAPGNADFVFTKPPASISVDSNATGLQTRWHFDLVDGDWQATVSILRGRGTREEALRVCLDVARARPDDNQPLLAASDLMAGLRGPEAAAGLLRAHLESHPDDLDVHRSHQHYLRRSGRAEEARSYYRSFRAARPGQAAPVVLLARVEPPETATALYEEALRLEPSSALARRGLAHVLLTQGRLEDSVRLFGEMEKDDPEYQYYVDDHVRSLLGANRPGEAAAVAARASEKYAADWRPAVLYAQLAASGAVAPPQPATTFIDRITKKSQDPEFGWWMLTLAGQPIDDARGRQAGRSAGPLAEAALIQQAAARDPALAWTRCAVAERPALERLGSPVAVLLAAEFRRAGDPQAAERLFAAESELNLPPAALEAYVMDGAEDPELWRLAPEVRAALDFVRSRRLAADGPASAALLAAARRREAVRGVVTRAIENWPPPERGAPTVTLRRRKAS